VDRQIEADGRAALGRTLGADRAAVASTRRRAIASPSPEPRDSADLAKRSNR